MAHIGFLPLSVPGHLYPTTALATHLKSRGHRVTFFGIADGMAFVKTLGFDHVVLAREQFPVGYVRKVTVELGGLRGRRGLKYTIRTLCTSIDALVAEGPSEIKNAAVEALVLDQVEMVGSAVAEHLKVPYVRLANALMLNVEAAVPPLSTGWGIGGGRLPMLRNHAAIVLMRRLFRPVRDRINAQRRAWECDRSQSS